MAHGIGKVFIRAKVGRRCLNHQLVEVFYVPELCENLFSTVEAGKQGCETYFYVDEKCEEKRNGRVQVTSKVVPNRPPVLDIHVVKPECPIMVNVASAAESPQVLHERLSLSG